MALRHHRLSICHRASRWGASLAIVLSLLPAANAVAASRPAAAHLTVRPVATTVAIGTVVAVTGTVTPHVAGITVVVQRRAGLHWLTVTSTRSTAKGAFAVNVLAPRKAGPWTIRAASGSKVVSHAATLTVSKTSYAITALLAQVSVAHGTSIAVTGAVHPKATGAVQLQWLDNKLWRTLATTQLTATSTFAVGALRPDGLSRLRVIKAFSKVVAAGTSTTLKVTVRPVATPVITTTTLPAGIVGRPYSATVIAGAGVGPYTWRVSSGAVPVGLILSPTGAISGTPVGVYTEAFGITVVGSDGGAATSTLSITIGGTSVTGWGSNATQQLVSAQSPANHVPLVAVGLSKVTSVAAGASSAYALRADGTVWAWGDNAAGQLGNGGATTERTNVPVQVSGLVGIVSIASGSTTAYALRGDGTVWAWGFNGSGELGNGTSGNSNVPVQVRSLTSVAAIAGGAWDGYALRNDGTVWAWGYDAHGEVGDGSVHLGGVSAPVPVASLTNVTAIAGGGGGGYAVRSDGSVWAWGANGVGSLGSGAAGDCAQPVQVAGVTGAVAVAGGATAGYALRTDGTVVAWGGNGSGQLGDDDTSNSPAVVPVSGLTGVVAIAAGGGSGYAVRNDGTVWSWGGNGSGQLGNDSTDDSHVPVQVTGLSGALSVAAGQSSAYALTSP